MIIPALICSTMMAASVPPLPQIAEARTAYEQVRERRPVRIGSFTVPSRVAENATVTCHWITPQDPSSTKGRSNDLVLYCPHPDDLTFAEDTDKAWKRSSFRLLAEESGFTVIGLVFQGQGKQKLDHFAEENRKVSYMFPESGSGEAVLAALAQARRELGLPDRPALAWGFSGGGIMAQHLTQWYPDAFDAAICQGPAVVTGRMADPTAAFLLVWTSGDASADPCRAAERWYQARETPVLALETAIEWGRRGRPGSLPRHCANEVARRLMTCYLEGAADLRRVQGARSLHRLEGWPCYATTSRPEQPYAQRPSGNVTASEIRAFPSWATWYAWAHRQVRVEHQLVDGVPGLRAVPSPLAERQAVVLHIRREASSSLEVSPRKADADVEWDLRQYADQGVEAVHAQAITESLLQDAFVTVPPALPLVAMVESARTEECVLLGASDRLDAVMLLGSVPELMQMKTSIEDLLRVGKTVHLLAQITEQDDPVGFKNLQDLVNQLRRPTNPATGGKKKPTNPPAAAKPISLTRLNHQETTGAQWASVVQSVCGKLVKKGTNPSPKP